MARDLHAANAQMALDELREYEVETMFGATGPAFPVIITPMTLGAHIQAPPDVEFRAHRQDDGSLIVLLRIPR